MHAAVKQLTPFSLSFLLHAIFLSPLLFSKSSQLIPDVSPFTITADALDFVSIETPRAESLSPSQTKQMESADPIVSSQASPAAPQIAAAPRESSAPTSSAQTGSGSSSTANDLAIYLSSFRKLISERRIYPAMSRRMNETGKVVVVLELHRDGRITNVRIKESAPFDRLNSAALETVSSIGSFQVFPDSVTETHLQVEVPLEYSL